jgi:metal-responsive CopG/Arc/MetJ family transcriptional regulator
MTNKDRGERQLLVWLDKELIEKFDEALKRNGYLSRAEFIREKIRELINKKEGK